MREASVEAVLSHDGPGPARLLGFPGAKRLRANAIADWCGRARLAGVVAFSCGNATAALRVACRLYDVHLIDLSPGGDLAPTRWWADHEVRRAWPGYLDGTPGHLPMGLMRELSATYRHHLGPLGPGPHEIPTGSGETVVCLAMAYPEASWVAMYDDRQPSTRYDARSPLADLVQAVCSRVVRRS